ncbi:hypothetical protein [Bradyrhizobium sp. 142]|uniref:hypothetical protein n=1 Tax=Bradyrhizobium sp. 142 TaxID=2782618 RepID=UPI001FF9F7FA|nr:hypothetical protein [Bradyrhizobium sp. 142]MCK1731210.1 hypothetical protein [Bradyrhizobium sp. 142]
MAAPKAAIDVRTCVVVPHQAGAKVDAVRHQAERGGQACAADQQDGLERRIAKTRFKTRFDSDCGKCNHAHVHSPFLLT